MAQQPHSPQNPQRPQGPSPDRGVLDEALEPEQLRSLNSDLRKLSAGNGVSPELRDMAQKLLSGRVTLRNALDDPSAARALGGGLASLRGKWEALSEEEREQVRQGEDPEAPAGSGDTPSGSSTPRRSEGERPEGGKKKPGRHSGGFSLY
ncbi:hypothetical protein [Streptomyces hypolithicus]